MSQLVQFLYETQDKSLISKVWFAFTDTPPFRVLTHDKRRVCIYVVGSLSGLGGDNIVRIGSKDSAIQSRITTAIGAIASHDLFTVDDLGEIITNEVWLDAFNLSAGNQANCFLVEVLCACNEAMIQRKQYAQG